MRLDTISGLRGRVVAYVETWSPTSPSRPERDGYGGYAIVERDDCPFPGARFSVHSVWFDDRGVSATNGTYDLSSVEAWQELQRRAGDNLGMGVLA